MAHLSPTELHDVAYGLQSTTSHLDDCTQCQGSVELLNQERAALRSIFASAIPAAPEKASAATGTRPRLWMSMSGIAAAAAGLLFSLILILSAPQGPSPAGQEDSENPEKAFKAIEEKIRKAPTLRIRYLRESIEVAAQGDTKERLRPFEAGELFLKDGERVHFVRRMAPDAPGGLASDYLTISDGKKAMGMVRDGGRVWRESSGTPFVGMRERLCSVFSRGGISSLTVVLPPGSAPEESKSPFWNVAAPTGFLRGADDAGARTLSYQLGGGDPQKVTLWYDSKSLRLLKRRIQDKSRGSFLETYEECSFNEAVPDREFSFPPGQEEFLGVTIPLPDYLELKAKGKIGEVWITPRELTADLREAIQRDGEARRKVRVSLPAEYRGRGKAAALLEGLDPRRVHKIEGGGD